MSDRPSAQSAAGNLTFEQGDLDRILKNKDLEDATVREQVHASILKDVCGN